jgi:NAD(P)-dependent dehydrogenase (short-subunit alcohol dehydrogenase family)
MQCILITGASRGLGLEFTRQYLARGARVFAGCRRPAEAPRLQTLREAHPQRLSIISLDVADPHSIQATHATVRSEVDGLDVLINNAGIYSSHGSDDGLERLGRLSFEDALYSTARSVGDAQAQTKGALRWALATTIGCYESLAFVS